MDSLLFSKWIEKLMNKAKMKKVIIGCEFTSCYGIIF